MLRKYLADPSHVLDATTIELREDLSFEETPIRILARENKNLRNRTIPYVKVQWSNHEEREASKLVRGDRHAFRGNLDPQFEFQNKRYEGGDLFFYFI